MTEAEDIFSNDSKLFLDSRMYLSNGSLSKVTVACLAISDSSYVSCNSWNYYLCAFVRSCFLRLGLLWVTCDCLRIVSFLDKLNMSSECSYPCLNKWLHSAVSTHCYHPLYSLWGYYLCFNSHWYPWAL